MKKSVNLYVLAASVATAAAVYGFDATLADPLAWLYPDSKVASAERIGEIDVPANGVVDVNILLNGLKAGEALEFSASEKAGTWCRMVAVPVKRNTGPGGFLERTPGDNKFVARRAPFEVFDALEPLAEGKVQAPKETEALYFRMDRPPAGAKTRDIRFRVKQGAETKELALKVNVHGASLPPVGKASFKYTNHMDLHSMAASHGLEPWSEAHWAMIEKYVRLAVRGRQNMAPIHMFITRKPDGDVEMDTARFERLLGIYDRAGIWYLEGPYLAGFTHGWGSPTFSAAGTKSVTTTVPGALALAKMAAKLQSVIERYGLKDRWIQHVADEPGGKNVPEYRITTGIVRRYMPGVRIMDAVEEPSFAGALDIWCPKVDSFDRHRALYDSFRTNFNDEVWCYTCCIPGGRWMNRLMDGELLRPALIPWVSEMCGVSGFLHWGYNRWQLDQKQDPFKEPYPKSWGGSNNGHSLPPGDTHIVYPGKDGPWSSARFEATRAGMEDADLLRVLGRRDKAAADALVRRIARSYGDYTPSCRLYRETRRDLLRALCGDAGPGPGWRLRWSDEFDGAQLDTNVWRRIPCGGADWDRHMSPRPASVAPVKDAKALKYSPMIFGHFIEHFDTQVYGGLFWPKHRLSDEDGFRKDVGFNFDAGLDISAVHEAVKIGKTAEAAGTSAVLDPVAHLLLVAGPCVRADVRLATDLAAPLHVLVRAESVGILDGPRLVPHGLAVRPDTALPVVVRDVAAARPTYDRHLDLAQRLDDVIGL